MLYRQRCMSAPQRMFGSLWKVSSLISIGDMYMYCKNMRPDINVMHKLTCLWGLHAMHASTANSPRLTLDCPAWSPTVVLILLSYAGTLVAMWYKCQPSDHEVTLTASYFTSDYSAAMPTQHVIPPGSVREYQRKQGSDQAYHALAPYLWPRTGVQLRAKETAIS